MVMNLVALGLVLLMAYLWMARGFWSALIHLVCTIVAGAVAFGLWEPVSTLLLGFSPDSGFLSFIEGIAWTAGLVIPFALTLVITRLAVDSAVPANVQNNKILDYAGGIACGGAAGVITAGILVIAVGYARVGTGFLGHRPIDYTEQRQAGGGSLERGGGLWLPIDSLTANLYGYMSRTSLRTGTPLADWHPNIEVAGYANKISYGEGKTRTAIKPADFDVIGSWEVGDGSTPVSELLVFSSDLPAQGYVDIDGDTVPTGKLVGYTIRFGAGARESTGQVIFGNGQVRLLMASADGSVAEAFPVAMVSQANASEATVYGRWRFEGNETFIASVGGATTVEMGFEFVVPQGFEPKALYVRNTRASIDGVSEQAFASIGGRDGAIRSGTLLGGGLDLANLDTSGSIRLDPDAVGGTLGRGAVIAEDNRMGFQFQTTQKRTLTLDEENRITGGAAKYDPGELGGRGQINADLRVDRFAPGDDTSIVQIDVGVESAASLLGRVGRIVDSNQPPQIIDTDGTVYQALGFIYQDNSLVDVRFTPATPLTGLGELPTLSGARTDQTLRLLFRVSAGVQMQYFAYGDAVVFELNPPVEVGGRQR